MNRRRSFGSPCRIDVHAGCVQCRTLHCHCFCFKEPKPVIISCVRIKAPYHYHFKFAVLFILTFICAFSISLFSLSFSFNDRQQRKMCQFRQIHELFWNYILNDNIHSFIYFTLKFWMNRIVIYDYLRNTNWFSVQLFIDYVLHFENKREKK